MNTTNEIINNYMNIGKSKCGMSAWKLIVLGILAGAFIGFAGLGATTASASIKIASVSKFVGACVFPVGLVMVVIAGSELFTGNCLLVIPMLAKEVKVSQVLRNWIFVYLGNLIGGLLVAAAAVFSHQISLFGGDMAIAVISTAASKCSMTFSDAFIKGICCNFLVCIAVWIGMASKEAAGKILGIFWPIMLFVLCGFEHSVANMYYIGAGLLAIGNQEYLTLATNAGIDISSLTIGNFLLANLLPVTLGNILGGGAVGLAYWSCYKNK